MTLQSFDSMIWASCPHCGGELGVIDDPTFPDQCMECGSHQIPYNVTQFSIHEIASGFAYGTEMTRALSIYELQPKEAIQATLMKARQLDEEDKRLTYQKAHIGAVEARQKLAFQKAAAKEKYLAEAMF